MTQVFTNPELAKSDNEQRKKFAPSRQSDCNRTVIAYRIAFLPPKI